MVGKFPDGIAEKIPQWIRANGGRFSRGMDAQVTHLIATEQAYKDNGPLSMISSNMSWSTKLIDCSTKCETVWNSQDRLIRLARGLFAIKNPKTEERRTIPAPKPCEG